METLFKIAEASANGIVLLMIIMSVISVSIMIERYVTLKKISSSSKGVAKEFKSVANDRNPMHTLATIEKLTEDTSSIEGRALDNGLKFVKSNGSEGLDDLFSFYKTVEKPGLEKNLNLLGTIASNAPYVGLLGTVMGIMKAFNDLANSPGQGNEVVMAGIAHALVSTAIGLAVAIPAVVAFNHFQKKVALILGNIDAARDLCLAYIKSRKA
jgi:biopolymer transport protein ExbB/TolQ